MNPGFGSDRGIQPEGPRYLNRGIFVSGGEIPENVLPSPVSTSVPVEMRPYREGGGASGVDSLYRHAFFVPKKSNQKGATP